MTTLANARTERKQWTATLKKWWHRCNTPFVISLPTATTVLLVLYIETVAMAGMLGYVLARVWGGCR